MGSEARALVVSEDVTSIAKYVLRSPYASTIFECLELWCRDDVSVVNIGDIYRCFAEKYQVREYKSRAEYVIRRFRELGIISVEGVSVTINCGRVWQVYNYIGEKPIINWVKTLEYLGRILTDKLLGEELIIEEKLSGWGAYVRFTYASLTNALRAGFTSYVLSILTGHFTGQVRSINEVYAGTRPRSGCTEFRGSSAWGCLNEVLKDAVWESPCGVCRYGGNRGVWYTASSREILIHVESRDSKYLLVMHGWFKEGKGVESANERLVRDLTQFFSNTDKDDAAYKALITTMINQGIAPLLDYAMSLIHIIAGERKDVGFALDGVVSAGALSTDPEPTTLLMALLPKSLHRKHTGLFTELAKLMLDINGHFIGTPISRLIRKINGEAQLIPMKYYELILMNPKDIIKDE
ncbi:MAG: hypothetical protein L7H00_04835 [Vulcanisaeta sp.]|nr:hypothetical protein [Vulcanisaeta sp.]